MALSQQQQHRIDRARSNATLSEASDRLKPESLLQLWRSFVSIVVDSLRVAFPKKHELAYIIHLLFPRYIQPLVEAVESESPLPSTPARPSCPLGPSHLITDWYPLC
jgi:hypothetical protein